MKFQVIDVQKEWTVDLTLDELLKRQIHLPRLEPDTSVAKLWESKLPAMAQAPHTLMEHLFKEIDTNQDGEIDYAEFTRKIMADV